MLDPDLVNGLGDLGKESGGFDPRKAYQICQRFPCAAATVIRAMLLKIGRPHAEVEHAVNEASEREAAALYANVRWLNLAAAVAPLLGLLGTVWGILQAFYATAAIQSKAVKADVLAEKISLALVTTLGGLAVAIPAAILGPLHGRSNPKFVSPDRRVAVQSLTPGRTLRRQTPRAAGTSHRETARLIASRIDLVEIDGD